MSEVKDYSSYPDDETFSTMNSEEDYLYNEENQDERKTRKTTRLPQCSR